MSDPVDSLSEDANQVQGSSPQNRNREYGWTVLSLAGTK
jgi:hypothetical protein